VKAIVTITPRRGVLDPQGLAVRSALTSLGFGGVAAARVGKVVELDLEAAGEAEARVIVESMCSRLLANPVLEEYSFRIVAEPVAETRR